MLHDELVHCEGDLSPGHNLPLESVAVYPAHQTVAAVPHVPLRVVLGELDLGQLLVLVTSGLNHFPGITLVSRYIMYHHPMVLSSSGQGLGRVKVS